MAQLQSRAFIMAVGELIEVPVVLPRVLADDYQLRARVSHQLSLELDPGRVEPVRYCCFTVS
jgi:hypothetical protein